MNCMMYKLKIISMKDKYYPELFLSPTHYWYKWFENTLFSQLQKNEWIRYLLLMWFNTWSSKAVDQVKAHTIPLQISTVSLTSEMRQLDLLLTFVDLIRTFVKGREYIMKQNCEGRPIKREKRISNILLTFTRYIKVATQLEFPESRYDLTSHFCFL